MTTALLDQLREGRFGRDVPRDVPQRADATTDGAEPRFDVAGYEVDADAVAGAIISRLLAGRTIPRRPAADR